MKKHPTPNQLGFGAVGILAAVVLVVAIAGVGYLVFKKSSDTRSATTPSVGPSPDPSPTPPAPGNEPNPYEGMTKYTNDKYGFSFYYPNEWKVEEVSVEEPSGSLPTEFAANINFNTTEKYKGAATFEIVDKGYDAVVSQYAQQYGDNSSAKVGKSEALVGGKAVTHFTINLPKTQPVPSKLEHVLFDAGNKTYSLRSINEELNVQRDPTYWDKFEKMQTSVELR